MKYLEARKERVGGELTIKGTRNTVSQVINMLANGFTIEGKKWDASTWKKGLMLDDQKWGIDVPSYRTWGYNPTFGLLVLLFFRKSTTRSYYLMNFSQIALRGAEIWHIWKQHHVIECFWKIMKSIFQIRSMQLQGDGLYTALLIKVLAYLLAVRLQAQGFFPN